MVSREEARLILLAQRLQEKCNHIEFRELAYAFGSLKEEQKQKVERLVQTSAIGRENLNKINTFLSSGKPAHELTK